MNKKEILKQIEELREAVENLDDAEWVDVTNEIQIDYKVSTGTENKEGYIHLYHKGEYVGTINPDGKQEKENYKIEYNHIKELTLYFKVFKKVKR